MRATNSVGPGLAALVLVLMFFPANVGDLPLKRRAFSYVDYPGMLLSLAGSVMLTFALEQGGLAYPWKSPTIVASFVVSGLALLAFATWEWLISGEAPWSPLKHKMLPLFPSHLITRRVLGFSML
jgi:hypothetical protein